MNRFIVRAVLIALFLLPCVSFAQAVNPHVGGLQVAVQLLDQKLASINSQYAQQGAAVPETIPQCLGQLKQVAGSPTILVAAQATCAQAVAVAPPRVRPIIKEVVKYVTLPPEQGGCYGLSGDPLNQCWAMQTKALENIENAIVSCRMMALGTGDGVPSDLPNGAEVDCKFENRNVHNTQVFRFTRTPTTRYTAAMVQPLVPPAPVQDSLAENLMQGLGGCAAGATIGGGVGYWAGKDAFHDGDRVRESTRAPYAIAGALAGCGVGGIFAPIVF